MIYQIRKDTKNTTHVTAHRGPSQLRFSTASQMETRESRILPACLGRPVTPLGLSGDVLNQQVCVDGLVISYQKQGRTAQTLLIWLTWWCGLYSFSSLQDRSSWWRSAIESVLISRSSFITPGSLWWKRWVFAMTSSVRCNTGNIRILSECEDIP